MTLSQLGERREVDAMNCDDWDVQVTIDNDDNDCEDSHDEANNNDDGGRLVMINKPVIMSGHQPMIVLSTRGLSA